MAQVTWTERALSDIEAITQYISKDSPFYANIFIKRVYKKVQLLLDFPTMGRVVPEYGEENIRELIFQSYRIIYRIVNDNVDILTVIHGSRLLGEIE